MTLTTVGYGDVVPVTLAGRIVAGCTMVTGMLMLALPIGIVATAFSEEIHKREFVVTWGMLSRVPLFASLNASEIAEVMPYLRAQTIPADTLIVRKGDPARCMYFISTAVEVELPSIPYGWGWRGSSSARSRCCARPAAPPMCARRRDQAADPRRL